MALPGVASIATYGGALKNFSAVRDSTTDRAAAGTNPAYGDLAAMTHTAPRAWLRFQPNGSSAPTFAPTNAHDEMWNNGNNAAPTITRSTTGTYAAAFPSTVLDEIPSGLDGANSAGYALNLRAPFANIELGSTTNYDVRAKVTAPNIITILIFTIGTSTLVDPNDGSIVGVLST